MKYPKEKKVDTVILSNVGRINVKRAKFLRFVDPKFVNIL